MGPDADEEGVVFAGFDEVSDIELEGEVLIEVGAGGVAIDEHLAVAGDRLEVEDKLASGPIGRHTKRPAEPAHFTGIPRDRITGIIEGAGIVRMARTGAGLSRAAPGVNVPGRGDFDRSGIPRARRRRIESRWSTAVGGEIGGERNGLKLPAAIQAKLLALGLFKRVDPAFGGSKVAGELKMPGARRCESEGREETEECE